MLRASSAKKLIFISTNRLRQLLLLLQITPASSPIRVHLLSVVTIGEISDKRKIVEIMRPLGSTLVSILNCQPSLCGREGPFCTTKAREQHEVIVFSLLAFVTGEANQASPLHQVLLIRSVKTGMYLQTRNHDRIISSHKSTLNFATHYQFGESDQDCTECFTLRDLSHGLYLSMQSGEAVAAQTQAGATEVFHFQQQPNGYWNIMFRGRALTVQEDGTLRPEANRGEEASLFEFQPFDQITIQMADTGLFVSSNSESTSAFSTKPSFFQTVSNWNLKGSQSLVDMSNGHFITAEPNVQPSAVRRSGGIWEAFTIRYDEETKSSTVQSTYNGLYLRRNSAGLLVADTSDIHVASRFTVTTASRLAIRIKNGGFVGVSRPELRLTAGPSNVTSALNYRLVANRLYPHAVSIQDLTLEQFVTAQTGGNGTLAAISATAGVWEAFRFKQRADGYYVMIACVNEKMVRVNDDGSFLASVEDVAEATLFQLHSAMMGAYTGIIRSHGSDDMRLKEATPLGRAMEFRQSFSL
ncbi:hypothetical protein PROFUN_14882 [Planoprotostelium fungivorum]|uniref:Fascin domain-containing protein n=1 Tax=Planoprotostelium fungivorum TaxID=1890364 RepID=A0A2P6MYH2_9EUKA|nr:hypothetical protein PROFUN_14882 [Planoprotostelium fungivorum]